MAIDQDAYEVRQNLAYEKREIEKEEEEQFDDWVRRRELFMRIDKRAKQIAVDLGVKMYETKQAFNVGCDATLETLKGVSNE